jgi:hypothetical protein
LYLRLSSVGVLSYLSFLLSLFTSALLALLRGEPCGNHVLSFEYSLDWYGLLVAWTQLRFEDGICKSSEERKRRLVGYEVWMLCVQGGW